jgi:hypothetical protein
MTAETTHKPLPSRKATATTILQEPSEAPPLVTVSSSALCVLTDFRKVPVATIGPDKTLNEATQEMIARGVRLLLVVERSARARRATSSCSASAASRRSRAS